MDGRSRIMEFGFAPFLMSSTSTRTESWWPNCYSALDFAGSVQPPWAISYLSWRRQDSKHVISRPIDHPTGQIPALHATSDSLMYPTERRHCSFEPWGTGPPGRSPCLLRSLGSLLLHDCWLCLESWSTKAICVYWRCRTYSDSSPSAAQSNSVAVASSTETTACSWLPAAPVWSFGGLSPSSIGRSFSGVGHPAAYSNHNWSSYCSHKDGTFPFRHSWWSMSCFAHCPALSHLEKAALGRLARQAAFRFGFRTVDCAFGCSR